MLTKDLLSKTLGAIIVAIAGYAASTMGEMSESLIDIKLSLNEVIYQLGSHEKRIDTLEGKIVGRGPGGWHRSDMRECMLELENKNPKFIGCDTTPKP